ncbi:hypothetical protein ACSBM8_04285 [Sphingomonas sp. ASY06-1R]|uniref:hypothetical protein n=1 Tax=Sphingomonas sp. ASY06-1R TaxID=3445771 RepID=UPI003FA27783
MADLVRRLDSFSRLRGRSRIGWAGAAMAVMLVCLAGTTARAELPPMSDAAMQSAAELIATGIVTAVSERDDVSYPAKGQKLVTGHWTVTVSVGSIEKGRLAPGEKNLRFTGSRNVVVPKSWVGGTNTLRLTPQVGDEVKVYLERTDGEWRLFHHLGLWLRR